ncbi:MAG: UDP-N-acetylmuramate dehydrogenase [Bacteroidia bacterium]
MPQLRENVSLKPYNTFGIDVHARYFTEVSGEQDVMEIIRKPELKELPKLILGGGSNMLFTKDFDGLVIKNNMHGVEVVEETDDYAIVKAESGETWHNFVLYCIGKGFGGIENLSLIPGTVGAAPIQNIGAYGVELQHVFEKLEAIHMDTGEKMVLSQDECDFGYRESVFKKDYKGQYFILNVTFRLSKIPLLNTSYGAIQKTLEEMQITEPDIAAVSRAVCHIRSTKLPDPAKLGNAGSFFKNPEIRDIQYNKLKENFPDIPGYPTDHHTVKVPAGWLIEQCGWRGKRVGNTGSHKDQSLVLVNYGDAKGEEIKNLAYEIQRSVKEKFGIDILPEVNIF